MFRLTRKRIKFLLLLVVALCLLELFGVFTHLNEKDFYTEFNYPYMGDVEKLVNQLKMQKEPDVEPINLYNFKFNRNPSDKCIDVSHLRLVYIIKSAPNNFDRRIAIRSSWGYEKRFADVEIRTLFLIGQFDSPQTQSALNEEYKHFKDIIQANYTDNYYNNTLKTMSGFEWAVKFCPQAKFYMFVDDDYYVSTKNVLRFTRNPTNYPHYLKIPMVNINNQLKNERKVLQILDFELEDNVRLYSGYVFKSSPLRHYFSKWKVSLEEYPYHMWPPYVTAGAVLLSREALLDMYYTCFYTKHFKFDDIYVGLLAYKAKIEPYHCEEFHFYKKKYDPKNFEYTIATHGYGEPEELLRIWTEQRSLGNA